MAIVLALLSPSALACFLHGDTLDTAANWLALFIIFALPIGGIWLFWLIHILPEKAAEKRHHPQKDAIKTLVSAFAAVGRAAVAICLNAPHIALLRGM